MKPRRAGRRCVEANDRHILFEREGIPTRDWQCAVQASIRQVLRDSQRFWMINRTAATVHRSAQARGHAVHGGHMYHGGDAALQHRETVSDLLSVTPLMSDGTVQVAGDSLRIYVAVHVETQRCYTSWSKVVEVQTGRGRATLVIPSPPSKRIFSRC